MNFNLITPPGPLTVKANLCEVYDILFTTGQGCKDALHKTSGPGGPDNTKSPPGHIPIQILPEAFS